MNLPATNNLAYKEQTFKSKSLETFLYNSKSLETFFSLSQGFIIAGLFSIGLVILLPWPPEC